MELNTIEKEPEIKKTKTDKIDKPVSAENTIFEAFSISEWLNGMYKINQHITQNYLKNFSSYHHDNRDISLSFASFFTELLANPKEMEKVQNFYFEFLQEQQQLYKNTLFNQNDQDKEPLIVPQKGDNRFKASHWNKDAFYDFLKQNHLLLEKLALRTVYEVETGSPNKKRLGFYTRQYAELLSPTNFLLTNPEAIELAIQSKGESLWKGFKNFVRDIEKGRITQVDETAYEVGKNLAITPGAVVFENELIQLIQYKPTTKNVQEIPLLIMPPWINKYYVLDLKPEESFVKYMVEQGFTVFVISWRNPCPEMSHLTFDDYVQLGGLKAIEVAKEISVSSKVNVLGYCLGGTLLGVVASILAAQKKEGINTLTFLGSMLDFSDIGPMGDVINGALVNRLERGELLEGGIMNGHDMERAFNLIRAKDLVWRYAIDNYLKGLSPDDFDIMYWTNDNTNLPARMYVYYMKEMIFKNKLIQKNALKICDTPIDIGRINAPVFIVAMEKDYISPPETVFITSRLVSGPVEFILGESGHVMGAINPPTKNKYGHYLDGKLENGFDEWQKTAQFQEGSWWVTWSEKLKEKSGKELPAPKSYGNKMHTEIEPAPGKYVKEKC